MICSCRFCCVCCCYCKFEVLMTLDALFWTIRCLKQFGELMSKSKNDVKLMFGRVIYLVKYVGQCFGRVGTGLLLLWRYGCLHTVELGTCYAKAGILGGGGSTDVLHILY